MIKVPDRFKGEKIVEKFSLFDKKVLEDIGDKDPIYDVISFSNAEKTINSIFGIDSVDSIFHLHETSYDVSGLLTVVYDVGVDNFITLVKNHLKHLHPQFNRWDMFTKKVFEQGEYKGAVGFMADENGEIYTAINQSFIFPIRLCILYHFSTQCFQAVLKNSNNQIYFDICGENLTDFENVKTKILELASSSAYIYPHIATEFEFLNSYEEIYNIMVGGK